MVNLKSFLLGAFSLNLSVATSAPQQSNGAYGVPSGDFNPHSYSKTYVSCPATDGGRPTNLKLGYLDLGNPASKKVLIMVHGWPSLWTTYRNQINYFVDKGYRLILPENRGFGTSEHPKNLNGSNTFIDFVNDIQCMMDHAEVESGVCVGNDFGAQVCWEAGRARPDRFIGVFNIGIPYLSPALGYVPNTALASLNPHFSYQVYLGNHPDLAAKEMNASIVNSIRSCAQTANSTIPADFLTRTDTFLGPWHTYLAQSGKPQIIPASGIMSQEVEDYMVWSYSLQGFYNTYNGYQSQNRNLTVVYDKADAAASGKGQLNFSLQQPTFSLFPTKDPVANWIETADQLNSSIWLPNHYNATIATAHWPHEELPDEFNSILAQWLPNVTFPH